MCVCVCFEHFWSTEQTSRLWRFIPVSLKAVGVVLLIPTEGRLNGPEHSSALPLCYFLTAGRGMMWMRAERVI